MKGFWKWLDGKKRTIGLVYWSVTIPVIEIMWPHGGAPENLDKGVAVAGVLLSAIGLGHASMKAAKAGKAKKAAATPVVRT